MKKRVSLSITISDTSISTAFVERFVIKNKSTLEKPIITTYRSKKINLDHQELTSDYLELRIGTLLIDILKDTRYIDLRESSYAVSDIQKIVISLSAPWFDSKIVTSRFLEAKPFKVTKDHMRKALDNEVKAISGNDKQIITVLETTILGSTLNGYAIVDPIGKNATSLTVNGYVSYMKTSLNNTIKTALDSFFHNVDEIIIKSEPTILLQAAIREAKNIGFENEFAIIRINEILTHIQVVASHQIREIGTIPIGLHNLLYAIESSCNVTREVAENVLSLYTKKKLESDFSIKIKHIIEHSLDEWKIAIKEFSNITISTGKFPSHVFLSSPTCVSRALKDYLLKDNYLDLTMSEEKLNIIILDSNMLNDFVDTAPTVKKDPGFLTKLNAII